MSLRSSSAWLIPKNAVVTSSLSSVLSSAAGLPKLRVRHLGGVRRAGNSFVFEPKLEGLGAVDKSVGAVSDTAIGRVAGGDHPGSVRAVIARTADQTGVVVYDHA